MRVLREYQDWYNHERYHQGIKGIPAPATDIADSRNLEGNGRLVAKPILNGLYHSYRLAA